MALYVGACLALGSRSQATAAQGADSSTPQIEANQTKVSAPLGSPSNPSDPFYPNAAFPKVTTPQWIGEPGVEAVVILAIDDMSDTAKYETFLRPILNRLKQIDGRAPLSIMTCKVNPSDPQLQSWL